MVLSEFLLVEFMKSISNTAFSLVKGPYLGFSWDLFVICEWRRPCVGVIYDTFVSVVHLLFQLQKILKTSFVVPFVSFNFFISHKWLAYLMFAYVCFMRQSEPLFSSTWSISGCWLIKKNALKFFFLQCNFVFVC